MIRTLYGKLVAVLLGFTLIMAVLFLLAIRHSDLARNQELNQLLYRNLPERTLTPDVTAPGGTVDGAVTRRIAERIQVVNPRISTYLLDARGRILAAPGLPATPDRAVDLDPVTRLLSGETRLPLLGDDPADPGNRRVFSAARVTLPDGAPGYLYLVIRGRGGDTLAQRVANSSVLRELMLLLGLGLLCTLLAAALIVKLITRPLRQLASFVDRFRQSGFAELPEPPRTRKDGASDEIGRLTDTVDWMAERILGQMQAMKRTDETRRELVANISHDLRTPLASLQGYLETLQVRHDVLSQEEKANYLQIALRNTEQLSMLVARLFELAKLDSDQARLVPEAFALDELIQDVGQEFELELRGRGARLVLEVPADLPLVYGDIGLVERVLRNLIENAVRYTPAGGTVTVAVTGGDGGCTVEVRDTGEGIAPEDLPHVFERFYRGEKSRGAAATHAGLGLAIVKRIVELHGGRIEASSRPGLTVFRFTLAYAPAPAGHRPRFDGAPRPLAA